MPQRKKTTARKPAAKKSTANRSEAAAKVRRQTHAVLLFAGAILLLCIVLIPGAMVWNGLHLFVRGVFGISALILPVVMMYIAVIISMEKAISVSGKLWQCGLLVLMISSVLYVFTYDIDGNYFASIGTCFTDGGSLKGGGVLGVLLGYPLEYFLTDVGSKIIFLLLAGVFLMLITGTTLVSLFHKASQPVKKAKDSLNSVMIDAAERRLERKNAPIDVEVGEGYPQISERLDEAVNSESLEAFQKAALELDEPLEEDLLSVPAGDPIDVSLGDLDTSAADSFPQAIVRAADVAAEEEGEPKKRKKEPAESGSYRLPPMALLDDAKQSDTYAGENEQKAVSELLIKTLQEFGITTQLVGISRGPTVTRYELEPSAGVKISKITGLVDDLALRLATTGVRIEAPIPNKAAVGIEVPNKIGNTVCLKELIDSREFRGSKSRLTVALGKDIAGNIIIADLAKMPHLLIAGTTGSGKSVCTNAMIQSVLYKASPREVRLILIDPKQVEFNIYNGIPHLLVPVVNDPRKAAGALGWAVTEMLKRYKLFSENNVRDLASYNELAAKSDELEEMPLILIVIDELSDLMMAAANEVEDAIIRLAQMARAAGMHLVIATQRPSVDVITGLIKANIPSRLALTVASAVDSRTILDSGGAERLLGKGDMLFMPVGIPKPLRVQGCFVSNREVESVVSYLKDSEGQEYDDKVLEEIERQAAATEKGGVSGKGGAVDEGDGDEMLPQAIEYVVEAEQASTSMLQRRLGVGYARAGRLIDEMEKKGIIGPFEGSKPRKVLLTRQQWLEMTVQRPAAAPSAPPAAPAAFGEAAQASGLESAVLSGDRAGDAPPWED